MRTVGAREFLGSFRTYRRGLVVSLLASLIVGGGLAAALSQNDEKVYYAKVAYSAPMDPREQYLINGQQIALGAAQNYASLMNSSSVMSDLDRVLGGPRVLRDAGGVVRIAAGDGGPVVAIEVQSADEAVARVAVDFFIGVATDTGRAAMPVDVNGDPVVTSMVSAPLEVRNVTSSSLLNYVFVVALALSVGSAYVYLRGASDRVVRNRFSLVELDDGSPLGVGVTDLGQVGPAMASRLSGMLNPTPGANFHLIDLTRSPLGPAVALALSEEIASQGIAVLLLNGTETRLASTQDAARLDGSLELREVELGGGGRTFHPGSLEPGPETSTSDSGGVVITISSGALESAGSWKLARSATRNVILVELGATRRAALQQVVADARSHGTLSCEIVLVQGRG